MSFPFEKTEPMGLKRTFLKSVEISLGFEAVYSADDLERMNEVSFAQFKMRVFENWDCKEINKSVVESRDKLIRFEFTNQEFSVRLKFPKYKKFVDILPYFDDLKKYIDCIANLKITKVAVLKNNHLPFKDSNKDTSMKTVITNILTSNLLSYDMDFDTIAKVFDKISDWVATVNFSENTPELNEIVEISYGFKNKEKQNSLEGLLLLIIHSKLTGENLDKNSIDAFLNSSNELANRAFKWSVQREVLEMLQQA